MTVRSFAGTIAFGFAAGVGFPVFSLVVAPIVGGPEALWLWIAAAALLHAALLGRTWHERFRGVVIATAFLVPGALLTTGPAAIAGIAALAIAIVRSFPGSPVAAARRLALEGTLAALGFALVASLPGTGLIPVALALWGWFLVQSVYYLFVQAEAAGLAGGELDPFDLAHERANALIEDDDGRS